jgi:hypothetical protein
MSIFWITFVRTCSIKLFIVISIGDSRVRIVIASGDESGGGGDGVEGDGLGC